MSSSLVTELLIIIYSTNKIISGYVDYYFNPWVTELFNLLFESSILTLWQLIHLN